MLHQNPIEGPATTDEALLKRSLAGEPELFSQLIERHRRKVYGLLWRLCGRRDDIDDLYQQVWIRIWGARASFRGESRFTTWMYSITLNQVREWRRQQRPQVALDAIEESAAPGPSALDRLLGQARRDGLQATLRTLAPADQEILLLRYQTGLSPTEAAEALGISPAQARVRAFRALARLRTLMKGHQL
jgi:RNA polymerase sigma-70 factor (ECF subfamily)